MVISIPQPGIAPGCAHRIDGCTRWRNISRSSVRRGLFLLQTATNRGKRDNHCCLTSFGLCSARSSLNGSASRISHAENSVKTRFLLRTLAAVAGLCAAFQNASGQSWTLTRAPNRYWNSLASSADGTRLVAAGSSGSLFTSTDSGVTWNSNQLHTAADSFTCVASSADGTRLLVGTLSDVLYTSTNAGVTWVSNNVPVRTWTAVASSADGTKLMAGSSGPIYTSADAGATWVSHQVPVTDDLPYFVWHGLASSADGTKLAAAGWMPMNYALGTRGGRIYTSTDSGATWQPSSAPDTNWCSIACSADGTRLIAGAYEDMYGLYNGAIFTSTNSGVTWRMVDAPETQNIQRHIGVACSADGARMVAAVNGFSYPGLIFISTDSGLTWSSNSSPVRSWSAVASSADGGKLVAAVYGGPIYTLQAILQPSLNITREGGDLLLSWIVPSSDFALQQKPDPRTTNWIEVGAVPTLTNLEKRVTTSMSPSQGCYRLKSR